MTPFDVSGKEAFFKTLREKEKMLVTSIFSFFHNVFYSIKHRNYPLYYIYFTVCKCIQFGQGQIFVVWELVKKPLKGSNERGLLQQVVFKCRLYQADLRRDVVSEQWSLKAACLLIQVVSNTG